MRSRMSASAEQSAIAYDFRDSQYASASDAILASSASNVEVAQSMPIRSPAARASSMVNVVVAVMAPRLPASSRLSIREKYGCAKGWRGGSLGRR